MILSPKKILTGIGAGATFYLLSAQSALAQGADVGKLGNISPVTPVQGKTLMQLVGNIVNIILIVVGVLAVLYLIYGGILYLTAGGDAEKASKGRVAITNAIIGIVIILLALAIYNFVTGNIETGNVTQ